MQQGEAVGENKRNPMLAVMHAELERKVIDGEPHPIRSECPVCGEGMFAVRFAKSTGLPMVADQCVKCGQRVGYADEQIDGKRVWCPMGAAFKFRSEERGGRKAPPELSKDKPYIAPARIINPDYFDPEARKKSIVLTADAPEPKVPYYLDDNMWSVGVWVTKQVMLDESDLYMVEPLMDEAPFESGTRFEMFEGDKIVAEGKIVSVPPYPAMTLAEFLEKRDEEAGQGTSQEEA